jgi:hypothetical protein
MDVAIVDRDVAYVAMVVHVCCNRPFSMFHLCFLTYVASEFIWILHMFHKYVASVLSKRCVCLHWFSTVFQVFFASVLEACFKCSICLQRNVASVAFRYFKSRSGVAHGMHVGSGRESELSPHAIRQRGDVRAAWAPHEHVKCWHGRRCASASAARGVQARAGSEV